MIKNTKIYIFISFLFVILICFLLFTNEDMYYITSKKINYINDTYYHRLYNNSKYYNNLSDDETLESKLFNKNNIIVLFNAPWSKECKKIKSDKIMPKLGKFNQVYIINDTHPSTVFYKNLLNFEKFPTLFVFKNKKFHKINDISVDTITKFVKCDN